jgi:hypothetical protein
MRTSHPVQAVALWFDAGRPARLVHAGERWRVSDMPTRLFGEDGAIPPMITHPPSRPIGWRFQATSATGVTQMFDVVEVDGEWLLGRVYD